MAAKRQDRVPTDQSSQLVHNPFADLRDRLGISPDAARENASEDAPSFGKTAETAVAKKGPPRAVVRKERKGHSGKEVTIIEKLEIGPQHRETWLREMKVALGCGGYLEGMDLVLQGDLRERAKEWLLRRGVRKVSVG